MLREYIEFGGFPEVADRDELLRTRVLQECFELTFYTDLVERYRIRNFGMVKEMMLYLVNNFSSYFSINKYYNMLKLRGKKVSKNTIFTYISHIADINFVFLVPKYGKLKEQFANPRKVYVIDTGLINAIAFKVSSDIGRLYENLVCVELKRRGKYLYYWKNRHECDFLVREGGEVSEAIQVCYDLTEENNDREISGIIELMNEFGLDVGRVITADFEGEDKIEGKKIIYMPLWRWLLE
ncbi:MAG: ATP-binding protein [Methanosarcinales archaeon]|nr:MAG: ATP-binding protein [Methanosarcinales archaeon]